MHTCAFSQRTHSLDSGAEKKGGGLIQNGGIAAVEPQLDRARRKAKPEMRGQGMEDLGEVRDHVCLE